MVAVLVLGVVGSIASSGSSEDEGEPGTAAILPSTTAAPEEEPTTAVATTVVPTTAPGDDELPVLDGFSECTDPLGDGTTGGDLTLARLGTQPNVLSVRFETADPVSGDTVLYAVNVDGYDRTAANHGCDDCSHDSADHYVQCAPDHQPAEYEADKVQSDEKVPLQLSTSWPLTLSTAM